VLKGRKAELNLASALKALGFKNINTKRQVGAGGIENADLQGIPGCHIEVKCKERLNIWDALEQAGRDAKKLIPLVFFKRNYSKWYVCIPVELLPALSEIVVDEVSDSVFNRVRD
jgi:hypothetical protein